MKRKLGRGEYDRELRPHPQWEKSEPVPVMRVEVGLSGLVDAKITFNPDAKL